MNKTFVVFGSLAIALSISVLGGDAKDDAKKYASIEVLKDSISDSAPTDLHQCAELVATIVDQFKSLASLAQPNESNTRLLNEMKSEKFLTAMIAFANVALEDYKDQPNLHPKFRAADLTRLDASVKYLRALANPADTTKPPAREFAYIKIETETRKEISEFLKSFEGLLKKEKFVDIAKNELDYRQEMPPERLKEALPQIVKRLEDSVKEGALPLVASIISHEEQWHWRTIKDGEALLVSFDPKGTMILTKNKLGKWKCQTIDVGSLENFLNPAKK